MKRAIGYIRISTKDQSNFSLDAQEDYVRSHCQRSGWELVGVYRDEGQSAKNFDRANWKALEAFIVQNHSQIDYLVVPKYDRFSRNVQEALAVMQRFEQQYKIAIVSAMEPVGVDPNSPAFFMFRTQLLTFAQFELMGIRDRTRTGQRKGAQGGRFLNRAPHGYLNARDAQGKPVLVVDEVKAGHVRRIYSLYISGMQVCDIARVMAKEGFSLNGNSAIDRILTNPLYCGMIRVPALYDEPEQVVEGLHEPIIDKGSWQRVQQMMAKPLRENMVIREEVPLRGALRCHCGKHMTAAPSRSKSGKLYWYYFCFDHRKENHSAKKLHGQFEQMWDVLSLTDAQVAYLQERVEGQIESRAKASVDEVDGLKRMIREVDLKMQKLEEKFVLDAISQEAYERMYSQWHTERMGYEVRLEGLQSPVGGMMRRHKEQMHLLGDIRALYDMGSVHQKQAMIRVVFDGNLFYQGGVYRTPKLLGVFNGKLRQLKERGLLFVEQPLNVAGESLSYPQRDKARTLTSGASGLVEFMQIITEIKRA